MNCVCATNGLHPCFRKSEVLHLALLNQLFHRSRNVFDRHVGVNAVLIEQIDDIGLEALQRGLSDFLDMLWPTIQAGLFAGVRIKFEPELGGNHDFPTERSESFAHEFFVRERAVNFGGVEECDAAFHGRSDDRDHLLLFSGRTVAKAHSHAAEPDSRDFQIAFSKFALLHCSSFEQSPVRISCAAAPNVGVAGEAAKLRQPQGKTV